MGTARIREISKVWGEKDNRGVERRDCKRIENGEETSWKAADAINLLRFIEEKDLYCFGKRVMIEIWAIVQV